MLLLGYYKMIQFLAVFGNLANREGPAAGVDLGKRVHRGNELVGERKPARRVVLLLRIVQLRAAGACDHVDHSIRFGSGGAVELLVQGPFAGSEILRRSERRLGLESQRKRTLVVVHVAGKDDVDSGSFKYI